MPAFCAAASNLTRMRSYWHYATVMRLYIGKNYPGNTEAVQSVFRLAGSDEDALTFALGFLLAHDSVFCAKLLKGLSVVSRRRFKDGYSIHLQEVTERGFGRRDIVVEGNGTRIVLEAKVGGAEPTVDQLVKYAKESNLWKQYDTRAVVALTQVELSAATADKVRSELSTLNIHFCAVQWHQVVDLVMSHTPSNDSAISRYFFDEFIRYIRRDYQMGYYDAEILIQDVNLLNAKVFREGWMYLTHLENKKAPLYFAPYFTNEHGVNAGISMLSRVMNTEIAVLADKKDIPGNPPSDEHRSRWQDGLDQLRKRAFKEGFAHIESRLFYFDEPITFRTPPLTKKSFNATGPSKQIPNQIPKGFSLGFNDLLKFGS